MSTSNMLTDYNIGIMNPYVETLIHEHNWRCNGNVKMNSVMSLKDTTILIHGVKGN